MISVFPDPYPDELLYSALARFQERMAFPSYNGLRRALFGKQQVTPHVDLPYCIDALVEQLPMGHVYTSERLLEGHTLLPFYAPFLAPEKLQQVKRDMRGTDSKAHSRLGLSASRRQALPFLRFCPVCVAHDRHEFGETYWHRAHQILGVEVCQMHQVWLQSSSAQACHVMSFVSAESVIVPERAQTLDLTNFEHQVLLNIAQDAAWLLAHPIYWDDETQLSQQLRAVLRTKGYIAPAGKVRSGQLKKAVAQTYSSHLLARLQCELDVEQHKPWIVRLVQFAPEAQLPIGYLLLFHFLGYTAEEIFHFPLSQPHPFGDSPWLCLNPVCPHYHQPCISFCELRYIPDGIPRGVFTCPHCGFSYLRTGYERASSDRFHLTVVKDYGTLWEEKLKVGWLDPTLTQDALATQLGIGKEPIRRQALRLGLPFPRPGRNARLPKSYVDFRRLFPEDEIVLRERYRSAWLKARRDHPDWGRTQLANTYMQARTWLYRYDREWFDQHLPPHKYGGHEASYIDWQARDEQLATAVEAAAQRLYQAPGRPMRVSLSAIGREAQTLCQLRTNLDRLPRTAAVVARVVETPPACAIRRIQWVAERYREAGTYPRTRYQFMMRTSARELMSHPDVHAVFEATYIALQN